jgi:hypothetical protein
VRRAVSQTDEYLKLFKKNNTKFGTDDARWCPPMEGYLKLNCDASFYPGDSHATWGVAVRDQCGYLITARAGKTDGIHDVFGAEL